MLEFMVEIDGVEINGVDMIRWNENGRIDDFKVMIRPLKAIELIHRKMREMLESSDGRLIAGSIAQRPTRVSPSRP